ncbi:MAG TPA: CvpA family protein [Caldimonas sp.]|jgi:membrane protein required for colicin V production
MTEWPALGWIDIAMLAVIVLSALAGAVRGLTFEILSLLGWVAAWFAGLWLGPLLAPHLPIATPGSPLNNIAAFAAAFLIVLILSGLAARAISALVGKTLLRPLDRLLGAVFGILRGLLVLLAVAIVVSFTPLASSTAWRESYGAVWLNTILHELVPLVAPNAIEPPAQRSV